MKLTSNERQVLKFIEDNYCYTVDFRDIKEHMGWNSPRTERMLKNLIRKNLIHRDYMDWYQVIGT